MSVLRREQRYVQRFRRRLTHIGRRVELHVDMHVEVRVDVRLVGVDDARPTPKPSEKDQAVARRDAWLAGHGIQVAHVRGLEVLDISGVLQALKHEIEASVPAPPRKPAWR